MRLPEMRVPTRRTGVARLARGQWLCLLDLHADKLPAAFLVLLDRMSTLELARRWERP